MVSFISVHRGASPREAKVVAVSADPLLVAEVARWLLEEMEAETPSDAILASLHNGRRNALRFIELECAALTCEH